VALERRRRRAAAPAEKAWLMAKRRRRPSPPPQGHVGPQTTAQMENAEIRYTREDSGALVRRKNRLHALEIMAATKHLNGKPKKREISDRQCAAGLRLHALHCMTELSPPSAFSRCFIDANPDPGAATAMLADRMTKFNDKAQHIPRDCERVVWHVVIEGKALRCRRGPHSRDSYEASEHRAQLQKALDILADHFGV